MALGNLMPTTVPGEFQMTAELAGSYRENGYLIAQNAYTDQEVEALRHDAARICRGTYGAFRGCQPSAAGETCEPLITTVVPSGRPSIRRAWPEARERDIVIDRFPPTAESVSQLHRGRKAAQNPSLFADPCHRAASYGC